MKLVLKAPSEAQHQPTPQLKLGELAGGGGRAAALKRILKAEKAYVIKREL